MKIDPQAATNSQSQIRQRIFVHRKNSASRIRR